LAKNNFFSGGIIYRELLSFAGKEGKVTKGATKKREADWLKP
jgi:hypothetical protein